jgi:hypothetical protein
MNPYSQENDNTMTERIRHFFAACWLAFTGLTIAQFNALLGTMSLILGISYQLWKWRKDVREAAFRRRATRLK